MWQLTKRNNSVRRTVRSQTNQIGLFPQPFILAVLTLPPRPSRELLVDTPSTSLPMVDERLAPQEPRLHVSPTYRPRINHASTTYHPSFEQISFTYRLRIVSASRSENDRRTIGGRYENNTGLIRNQYGIDTRMIRDDSQPRILTRNLTFPRTFLCIIFYILLIHYTLSFMQR